jgi:hypothetical protein
MITFKKQNLSIILGILLLILMYNTPQFLKNFSNQVMGKIILVGMLAYFALDCDMACAIIFAIIIIVLLHDNREGFKEGTTHIDKFFKKATNRADAAEKKLGFKTREGMEDGTDDHKHTETNHKQDEEDDEEEEDIKEGSMMNDDQEGFIGLNNMKNVTNKLQNYLGFSVTDLDRFMKTSSEKNTIASTKDH